ncbi:UNVERIFIED_CONTAM: hypothetical protein Sradi_4542800 [Sesamum radiatum]|uniref:Reverse transcriptase domain-containing protein n=1 Tax=Sesamum radiatum TaxID=300843 RepID=A0AAW2N933_SESRA
MSASHNKGQCKKIFNDMLQKNVECYIDDLVVKSKKRENHFHNLRKVSECLRRYELKTKPSKCASGVTFGKFLGLIVRHRGDVGRLCSFSGLVGKSRAYEDYILDMASGGCVMRHDHHKPYPVHSEYVARTVDSERGSIPCHHMTESSPIHLEMV